MAIDLKHWEKSQDIEYPVVDLIKNRKSTRAFSTTTIPDEIIKSLFEATRWAPSSVNEQPWMYVYATKEQPELFGKIYSVLFEGNRIWAKDAPLLIVSLARLHYSRYSGVNTYAHYDLGGANAFLALQAVELGLQVRQMAGFDKDKAREVLNVPTTFDPVVVIAAGFPGSADTLPRTLQEREAGPRERYSQSAFVRNEPFPPS